MKQNLEIYKLDNGLELILFKKKNIPIFSMNLIYKVGSKNEIKGKTGLAHLCEHLMFEGTKKFPKGNYDKIISTSGGTNNAYTNYDWTSYTLTLPKNKLKEAFELESDRMFGFNPSNELVEIQKSVVIEEIKQTIYNQAYGKWREKLASIAFDTKCSYYWEVPGFIEDIEKFELNDVIEFNKKHYLPQNAKLVLSGDLDIDECIKLANEYFNFKSNALQNKVEFSKEFIKETGYISFQENVPLNATFLAFHIDGFYNIKDNIIAELICNIIGQGKSSNLVNNLVYKSQIASQVGAFLDRREFNSLLTFYMIANNNDLSNDFIFDSLMKELFFLKNSLFTDSQMQKAKNVVWTQMASELEQNYAIADNIAFYSAFFDKADMIFSIKDMYNNITIDDLNQFIINKINLEKFLRVDAQNKG